MVFCIKFPLCTVACFSHGGNFIADKRYPNVLALLMRTVDLFMYRIKAVQMVQNLYGNVQGAGKPIAYFSLGWRIDNAIPGFVRSLCAGQLLSSVIKAHGLEDLCNTPAILLT